MEIHVHASVHLIQCYDFFFMCVRGDLLYPEGMQNIYEIKTFMTEKYP